MENWAGRECAELQPSEHAVECNWDNRSERVDDVSVAVAPGGRKIASFPRHMVAPSGTI